MKITVCIGSSCHIKGSRQVVEQLQYLIHENNLGDKHLAHRCALCGACIRECPMHLPIAKHMRCIGKLIDLSREPM